MRSTLATLATLIFSFCFFLLTPNAVHGFVIKLDSRIEFGENAKLQNFPRSFCVTEDGFFLIPDYEEGKVQILKRDGKSLKLAKTLCRKGTGKYEFNRPSYCFYTNFDGKFGVIDINDKKEERKVIIYDRLPKVEAEFDWYRIIPGADGYDIQLGGDGKKLVISGYITDENERSYELYTINVDDPQQVDYLLPSYKKYQLPNDEVYQREYFQNRILPSIGIRAFIDVQGDAVYFVWEGKLKIIKIDLNTGNQIADFGQSTGYYVEPKATQKLLDGRRDGNYAVTKEERKGMSFVRDIFATPRHVFVVYEGPGQGIFRMQMYAPEGMFLGDIPIPETSGSTIYSTMWFEKDSYTLYCFSTTDNGEKQILVYKVKI